MTRLNDPSVYILKICEWWLLFCLSFLVPDAANISNFEAQATSCIGICNPEKSVSCALTVQRFILQIFGAGIVSHLVCVSHDSLRALGHSLH